MQIYESIETDQNKWDTMDLDIPNEIWQSKPEHSYPQRLISAKLLLTHKTTKMVARNLRHTSDVPKNLQAPFNYSLPDASLYKSKWAATETKKLYVLLQKDSGSVAPPATATATRSGATAVLTGTPTRHHPPMAQLASEETPSTPPNTTNHKTGFIPTITDSRRALVPAARPGISRAKKTIVNHSEDDIDDNDDGDGGDNDGEDEDEEGDDNSDVDGDHDEHHSTKQTKSRGKKAFSVMKQVSSRTGKSVNIDTAQDSDEENSKVTGRKKKDPTKNKDGTDHARLYFYPQGKGPNQEAGDPTWACRWCNNKFAISGGSYWNLKCHRDGVKIKNSLRSACAGCLKCIEAGANLPPTVAERLKALNHPSTGAVLGTLIGYVTKGQFTFNNKTLNKLLVIWIVRQSLPWLRMEDFHLRVAFDYTLVNTSLNSRIWAALHAHQLYLEQRAQVLQGIR
ncbi:hypothetical protein H4Q26_015734, partial [Puccinia striiformis f. sp. tritici PST-130]